MSPFKLFSFDPNQGLYTKKIITIEGRNQSDSDQTFLLVEIILNKVSKVYKNTKVFPSS